jgi:hypothetical protein
LTGDASIAVAVELGFLGLAQLIVAERREDKWGEGAFALPLHLRWAPPAPPRIVHSVDVLGGDDARHPRELVLFLPGQRTQRLGRRRGSLL